MEPTLVAVTLLSLGMASAMSIVAWRLVREERRRSAARVARLAELAARDDRDPRAEPRLPARPNAAPPVDPLDRPLRQTPPIEDEPPAAETAPAPGELFAAAAPASGGSRRALVLAVAAVLVVAVIATIVSWGGAPGLAGRSPAAGRVAPLELLSLGHTRHDETLTIAGLVQNPKDGRELRNVIAVAFVFDRAGAVIGSGRAALDFSRLTPGAESSFVIRIDRAGNVGRYRIGFRTDDGSVIGHVDRRASSAINRPERASAAASAGPVTTATTRR